MRFRKNSLRLRVNQQEVAMLAAGEELAEQIAFAGGATLSYMLASSPDASSSAEFDGKVIRITAPLGQWVHASDIGYYFEVRPGLKVAIEKDLECVDGPEEEKDPLAYPRLANAC